MAGETFGMEEMYLIYNRVANFQGEKEAERSTHYALEAEKIHAKLYAQAKEVSLQRKDLEVGTVYVCPVCGYTVEGSAPDHCPVCGAPKNQFKTF